MSSSSISSSSSSASSSSASSSSSSFSSSSASSSSCSSSSSRSSSSSSSCALEFPELAHVSAPGYPQEFVIDPALVTVPLGQGSTRTRVECQDAFRGWRDRVTNLAAADYAEFEEFYRNHTKRSVRPFTWHNRRTGEDVLVRFWFREPPRWQRMPDHQTLWTVEYTVAEYAGATGTGYGGANL